MTLSRHSSRVSSDGSGFKYTMTSEEDFIYSTRKRVCLRCFMEDNSHRQDSLVIMRGRPEGCAILRFLEGNYKLVE